ncbi:MAG TPA: DUF6263 family protein [Chitinophagaceae bacterium]|nr:DUF6263 family protein [Chitinophagaceae bacterium]
MKKIILIISAVFTISDVSLAQSNGKLNLSSGQKYLVENKITTSSSSEMMGQTMESKADFSSNYKIEVKEIKGDNINFVNTITGMKMSVTAMGQDMNFDSDKKEDMDGELGKNFKDIINQPKDVVMDKTGNVIIAEKIDTASKTNSAASPTEMMMKQLGGDPAEQGYGAKIAFEVIPKGSKVGASWSDSSSNNGISKVTNYTIKELNGGAYTISLSGTIDSEIKTEMQGMEIQTKTKGKFTGEEIVDVKTGVIKQNTTNTDASGTVNVMSQEIPTSTKVTSVTTVTPQ